MKDLVMICYFVADREEPIASAMMFTDIEDAVQERAKEALARTLENRPELADVEIVKKRITLWGNSFGTMHTSTLLPE